MNQHNFNDGTWRVIPGNYFPEDMVEKIKTDQWVWWLEGGCYMEKISPEELAETRRTKLFTQAADFMMSKHYEPQPGAVEIIIDSYSQFGPVKGLMAKNITYPHFGAFAQRSPMYEGKYRVYKPTPSEQACNAFMAMLPLVER